MAKYTVKKGDTLWSIAKKELGDATLYQKLAKVNKISNPNLIYVGQVIELNIKAGGSSSSSSSSSSNVAVINAFGLQSNTDSTLFATWTWSKDNTENYEVIWYYDTGDKVWFIGNESTTENKQSTYSFPSNAKKVKFKVKPISKKHTVNNKETSYWTASWSTEKVYNVSFAPPIAPGSAPNVKIEKYTLTAEYDNLDGIALHAEGIQFEIVKNNDKVYDYGTSFIKTGYASYSRSIDAGAEYKVRARSYRESDDTYGEWTDYSDNQQTIPATPSGITSIKANSKTSVYLEWSATDAADSYNIEYTTKKQYFDASNQTTSVNDIKNTHYEITGLDVGQEYFFRIRAVNEGGESGWSDIVSIVLGEKPAAPTTWSSTTTVITGEELILYWVHNGADGSSQTFAELEIIIGNVKETHTIENTRNEDEKDKTSLYIINTSQFVEGTKIKWRVRTAGVTKEYGEWSVERTVDVYAPPTLVLDIENSEDAAFDVLTSFPFYIYALPGPKTQAPISYHLSIVSNQSYETLDNVGNTKVVNAGEEVYSKHFDIKTNLAVEMSASNIDLENNVRYTVICTVSMDSGLTAEASKTFTVSWVDQQYMPNAEIGIDRDTLFAHIRPYCEDIRPTYYMVAPSGSVEYAITDTQIDISTIEDVYTDTGELVLLGRMPSGNVIQYCPVYADVNGNPINPVYYRVDNVGTNFTLSNIIVDVSRVSPVYTVTGEEVYIGIRTDTLTAIHYCRRDEKVIVNDVALSVYRREYDGSFTEIITGLDNTKYTYVTDPHPALDYARYRIVAVTNSTGAVSYYDVPGYPVGETAVVIQWDEEWSNFNTSTEDPLEQPPWSGSLIKLPYNIDVSDGYSPDVSHIAYIGRKHPVSYYGTQLGITSNWKVDIAKSDKDTLYALRRLAIWLGNVYVREPSGSGYWANVTVSFSQTHRELTIPVSLAITRVEGGM